MYPIAQLVVDYFFGCIMFNNDNSSASSSVDQDPVIPFMILPPLSSIILPPLEPRAELQASDQFFLSSTFQSRGTKRTERSIPPALMVELTAISKIQRTLWGKQPIPIEIKLIQFKIDPKDYLKFYNQLKDLGYEPEDINKLILNRSRKLTLEKLVEEHDNLMELCREDKLNHKDLAKIGACNGGCHNLDAFKFFYRSLRSLSYSKQQIVTMAAHHGGSKNLASVIEHHNKLFLECKYTVDQIVKIVSRNGGARNLDALSKYHHKLISVGLNKEEIIGIVDRSGGSKSLKAVAQNYTKLINLGYKKEQVLHWASNPGCDKVIEQTLSSHSAPTKGYGFFGRMLSSLSRSVADHPDQELSAPDDEPLDPFYNSPNASSMAAHNQDFMHKL